MMETDHTNEERKTAGRASQSLAAGDFGDNEHGRKIDEAYLRAGRSPRFYRSVLFQMVLFGALSFVGPAMGDAISNLGGGGLSSPYLGNLANALQYASGCIITLLGGPLINKLGIKWSCMIAAVAFPLAPSSYYVSARYGVDWYLMLSNILSGFTSGFLYVAETTAMLSYPEQNDRGFYLGVWSAMRSSGSVLGGAINFALNSSQSSAGGISWSTYLIFVAFACTGVIWVAVQSPTTRVRRRDGSKISMDDDMTWKQEFRALWVHCKRKKTWLVFLPAFYSFFYGGTMGTYLSLRFSVRSRALSTLIVPSITMPVVLAYGKLLDTRRWSQVTRAWLAFVLWAIPQIACMVWIGIEYKRFDSDKSVLDYEGSVKRWLEAYVPYLVIFVTGYWTQLSLYWILGTFSIDVSSSSRTSGLFRSFETAGQAVSYAINSNSDGQPQIPFYINCAVLAIAIPCMVSLIRMVPEAPALKDMDILEGISDENCSDAD